MTDQPDQTDQPHYAPEWEEGNKMVDHPDMPMMQIDPDLLLTPAGMIAYTAMVAMHRADGLASHAIVYLWATDGEKAANFAVEKVSAYMEAKGQDMSQMQIWPTVAFVGHVDPAYDSNMQAADPDENPDE